MEWYVLQALTGREQDARAALAVPADSAGADVYSGLLLNVCLDLRQPHRTRQDHIVHGVSDFRRQGCDLAVAPFSI